MCICFSLIYFTPIKYFIEKTISQFINKNTTSSGKLANQEHITNVNKHTKILLLKLLIKVEVLIYLYPMAIQYLRFVEVLTLNNEVCLALNLAVSFGLNLTSSWYFCRYCCQGCACSVSSIWTSVSHVL